MTATIVTTVSVLFDGSTVTDISSRVEGLTINYGRARVIDEFGAGFASITVDDRDNFITPGHSDSTMGNTQLIGRQVRISTRVTGGSDSYDTYLFRGFIQDVDYLPGTDHQSAKTILKCVDGFELLARAKFESENFSEQLSSLRVTAVLDLASVNYPDESTPNDRTINEGSTTCIAATGVSSDALDYLQVVARTENGRFLINHAGAASSTNFGGVATFFGQNTAPTVSGLTISDASSFSTGDIQAEDLQLEYGSELLYNAYSYTPGTGSLQTGEEAASIVKYGRRTLSKTTLSNASSTNAAGIYFIGLYKEPLLRVSSATVQVDMATTVNAEKILHLNVQSALDLSILPPGSSATLSGEYIVEGVQYTITPRDMATNQSKITAIYQTSAADTTGYWILGDPSLGAFSVTLAPGG
tara:strand:- start:481 stop:1722 length:1242 start_codon:yes stop_codon:yes gene_type:complete